MKKLALLLLTILAADVFAQEVRTVNFAYQYDLDSATLTYVRLVGIGGNPYGGPIAGDGTITSTGTAVEASSTTSFQSLGAGDILVVNQPTATAQYTILQVASVTDGDTLVLVAAPASDFTTAAWRWLDLQVGTGAEDGWVEVYDNAEKAMTFQYEQGDGDVDVRWECRGGYLGALPVRVYPGEGDDCGGGTLTSDHCRFTAANVGITNRLTLIDLWPYKQCRVGIKLTGADASDAGANLERITIGLEMRPSSRR